MTQDQQSLSKKYLIYRTLSNLWFISALWLFFYRIYITDQQIGVLEGVSFAIGLIAEVPSGVLADKYGRDNLVRTGQLLAGIGIIIQAFGTNLIPFFVGQTIVMVGVAFTSGADEALFFNKLKFDHGSLEWRKLLTKGSQVALVGGMLATVLGGWVYTLNPKYPWLLTGVAFVASAVVIWPLKDNRDKKKRLAIIKEVNSYVVDITLGFKRFIENDLRIYLPLIIFIQGLFYTTGWGLLRLILLDRFHFEVFGSSIVITISRVVTIIFLAIMHKYASRFKEKNVITVISVSAIFALTISLADIGVWGSIVILLLYAGEHILHPFMSEILNKNVEEKQRATVLSVASFLRTLPYVLLAPIIGYLNTIGKLEYFLVGWTFLMVVALYIYLSLKKRDDSIRLVLEN